MLDYLWIVIAGGITSFTAAMGIGSNDVANALKIFYWFKSINSKICEL